MTRKRKQHIARVTACEVEAWEHAIGRTYQEWRNDPKTNRRTVEEKRYQYEEKDTGRDG